MRTVRQILVSLSLAENMGDVADDLPDLARLLGEPEPEWSDERGRYVFPWEAGES